MNKTRSLALLLILGAGFFLCAQQEMDWEVRAQTPEGEFEYDPATGEITSATGVIMTYGDIVLTADRVRANERTGEVLAEGNVRIEREGQLWTGERAVYNFRTRQIQAESFRTSREPLYVHGEHVSGDEAAGFYEVRNAYVTTDDYATPAYRVRTRRLKIVMNEYVEARGATLLLGDVPVFYFPRYIRRVGRPSNRFNFTPGYRSVHGVYLLSSYDWYWNDQLQGALHLDWRQKRGVGLGPDFSYDLGQYGRGAAKYYFLRDQDPDDDAGILRIPDDRQRFSFSHHAQIRTNLAAKAIVRYQSDPLVIRDFFESEYRDNVQPGTFLEVEQAWQNLTINALVQPRINDFFETVERLPDVRLTALRQQIGVTPLYYESQSSAGHLRRRFADGDPREDFDASRFDSYHQLVLPQTYLGWLNFLPRVGMRYTWYSEAHGRGITLEEERRHVFNTGAEVNFKASRVWSGAQNKLLEVNGIRHIIQPSLNYVFVPNPNVRPPELPQFDYEVPSLRLLPIEYPDYNAIDAIDSQNVLRFGLRNKVQTKREDGIENLLNWALYADWRLDPNPAQRTFSHFYSDADLRPRSWLMLTSQNRWDINDGLWREAGHRLTIAPNNVWSLTLGHRYLRENEPDFVRFLGAPAPGHNTFYSSVYYRLNENWGTRMTHRFEARDGTLEEQYYSLYRDLRTWTAALTFRVRQSRQGRDDFGVAITFSLKAFPRFGLGDDRDRPTLLLGS